MRISDQQDYQIVFRGHNIRRKCLLWFQSLFQIQIHKDGQEEGNCKVPFHNIPVLGFAFRNSKRRERLTEIIIFLSAETINIENY